MPCHKLACPEGILHVRISNVLQEVTVEVLRRLFRQSGDGDMLCAFERVVEGMYGVEAYVQFRSRWEATRTRDALNGLAIYEGCCVLAIDLVPPIYTTITTPDDDELAPAYFFDDTPYVEWAEALDAAERHDEAPAPSSELQIVPEVEHGAPPTTCSTGWSSCNAPEESAFTSSSAAPSSITTVDDVPELTATGGCSTVAHITCSTTDLDPDTSHIQVAEVPLLVVEQFLMGTALVELSSFELATAPDASELVIIETTHFPVGKLSVKPSMVPPTAGSIACSGSDEGVSSHVPSTNQCSPVQWKPPWPLPSQGILERLFMNQPYGNLNYYATRITLRTSSSYDHHYLHMEFGSFSLELLFMDECWKYWNCEPGYGCALTEESDAELLHGLVSSVVPCEQHHSVIAFENLLGALYWMRCLRCLKSDMHLRVSCSFWPHMQQFSDNGWLSFEVEISATDMVLLPKDTIQLQFWPPPSSMDSIEFQHIHLVMQSEYGAPLLQFCSLIRNLLADLCYMPLDIREQGFSLIIGGSRSAVSYLDNQNDGELFQLEIAWSIPMEILQGEFMFCTTGDAPSYHSQLSQWIIAWWFSTVSAVLDDTSMETSCACSDFGEALQGSRDALRLQLDGMLCRHISAAIPPDNNSAWNQLQYSGPLGGTTLHALKSHILRLILTVSTSPGYYLCNPSLSWYLGEVLWGVKQWWSITQYLQSTKTILETLLRHVYSDLGLSLQVYTAYLVQFLSPWTNLQEGHTSGAEAMDSLGIFLSEIISQLATLFVVVLYDSGRRASLSAAIVLDTSEHFPWIIAWLPCASSPCSSMVDAQFCSVLVVPVLKLGNFVQLLFCFVAAICVRENIALNYSVADVNGQEKGTCYAECNSTLLIMIATDLMHWKEFLLLINVLSLVAGIPFALEYGELQAALLANSVAIRSFCFAAVNEFIHVPAADCDTLFSSEEKLYQCIVQMLQLQWDPCDCSVSVWRHENLAGTDDVCPGPGIATLQVTWDLGDSTQPRACHSSGHFLRARLDSHKYNFNFDQVRGDNDCYLDAASVNLDHHLYQYIYHHVSDELKKSSVPWDPGDSAWCRLGVKPKFKKGGLSATLASTTGLDTVPLILGLGCSTTTRDKYYKYKEMAAGRGGLDGKAFGLAWLGWCLLPLCSSSSSSVSFLPFVPPLVTLDL